MRHNINAFALLLALSAYGLSAWGQHEQTPWTAEYRADQVKELKREGRLPEWANYICAPDQIGLHGSLFLLVAFQQPFAEIADGYTRGLTYQDYFGADEKGSLIEATNLPGTPEQLHTDLQANQSHMSTEWFVQSEIQAVINQQARIRQVVRYLSDAQLKNPLIQALLDGPEGTNYRNLTSHHPEVFATWLAMQKYENTGWDLPADVKEYREGNVIYETTPKGTGTFESPDRDGLMHVRIQFSSTPSGLRLDESHPKISPLIISNACDPIPQQHK